jgi:hypothetical protein
MKCAENFSQPKNVAMKKAEVNTRALREFIRIWSAEDRKQTDMYKEKCLLMKENREGHEEGTKKQDSGIITA